MPAGHGQLEHCFDVLQPSSSDFFEQANARLQKAVKGRDCIVSLQSNLHLAFLNIIPGKLLAACW